MSTERDELLGKSLGQFEILDEIGRGGMATVYRARQLSINRIVALKVLPRNLLHDPSFYERFEREVDVIAHLEHPHILPIYDYGKAEGVPYIAMRYLSGGSFAQLLRRGIPTPPSLERPLSQVAEALDYAHQQGIIHRDLKPGNMMLDENGNAYLTDFGIARVLNSNLTGSAIIGTPAYMSPEQANGLPLDARSDIYAMGVVLFEMLTGREPYEAETPVALLLKHINEPMPSVRMFRPGVSPAVEAVVMRATAKDPSDRYASGTDMARAFRAAVQNVQTADAEVDQPTLLPDSIEAAHHTPRPPTARAATRAAAPSTGQVGGTQQVEAWPTRRSPLPVIAAVVVVIAILVVAAILVVPKLSSPTVVDITPTPSVLAAPTPMIGSQLVRQDRYSIAVPNNWQFSDISSQHNNAEMVHVWQDGLNAYIGLAISDQHIASDADFQAAIRAYQTTYYDPRLGSNISLIDESTAPDGSVRRSYRLFGDHQPPFPAGQTDVFYLRRDPYLVVMETYSSDALGSTLVPVFQQALDSLRLSSG